MIVGIEVLVTVTIDPLLSLEVVVITTGVGVVVFVRGVEVLVMVTTEPELSVVVVVTGTGVAEVVLLKGVDILVVVMTEPLLSVVVMLTGTGVRLVEAAATGVDPVEVIIDVRLINGVELVLVGLAELEELLHCAVTVVVAVPPEQVPPAVTVTVAVGAQTELEPDEMTAVTVTVFVTVVVDWDELLEEPAFELPPVDVAAAEDELLEVLPGTFSV